MLHKFIKTATEYVNLLLVSILIIGAMNNTKLTLLNVCLFQVSFWLKYSYKNMVSSMPSEQQEPPVTSLQHIVCVNLGPLSQ